MSELSAAMGLTSFESMEDVIQLNRRNHEAYRRGFESIPGIQVEPYDEGERNNYQYVVAEIDSEITGLSRDNLVKLLHRENVLVRRYFSPGCHRHEPYASYFPFSGLLLPETERVCQRVIQFPTGNSVSLEDIETIVDIVRTAVANADLVRAAIESGH
jgi:dTDP-4-amino-4,6-dideoxygalactose transaminase